MKKKETKIIRIPRQGLNSTIKNRDGALSGQLQRLQSGDKKKLIVLSSLKDKMDDTIDQIDQGSIKSGSKSLRTLPASENKACNEDAGTGGTDQQQGKSMRDKMRQEVEAFASFIEKKVSALQSRVEADGEQQRQTIRSLSQSKRSAVKSNTDLQPQGQHVKRKSALELANPYAQLIDIRKYLQKQTENLKTAQNNLRKTPKSEQKNIAIFKLYGQKVKKPSVPKRAGTKRPPINDKAGASTTEKEGRRTGDAEQFKAGQKPSNGSKPMFRSNSETAVQPGRHASGKQSSRGKRPPPANSCRQMNFHRTSHSFNFKKPLESRDYRLLPRSIREEKKKRLPDLPTYFGNKKEYLTGFVDNRNPSKPRQSKEDEPAEETQSVGQLLPLSMALSETNQYTDLPGGNLSSKTPMGMPKKPTTESHDSFEISPLTFLTYDKYSYNINCGVRRPKRSDSSCNNNQSHLSSRNTPVELDLNSACGGSAMSVVKKATLTDACQTDRVMGEEPTLFKIKKIPTREVQRDSLILQRSQFGPSGSQGGGTLVWKPDSQQLSSRHSPRDSSKGTSRIIEAARLSAKDEAVKAPPILEPLQNAPQVPPPRLQPLPSVSTSMQHQESIPDLTVTVDQTVEQTVDQSLKISRTGKETSEGDFEDYHMLSTKQNFFQNTVSSSLREAAKGENGQGASPSMQLQPRQQSSRVLSQTSINLNLTLSKDENSKSKVESPAERFMVAESPAASGQQTAGHPSSKKSNTRNHILSGNSQALMKASIVSQSSQQQQHSQLSINQTNTSNPKPSEEQPYLLTFHGNGADKFLVSASERMQQKLESNNSAKYKSTFRPVEEDSEFQLQQSPDRDAPFEQQNTTNIFAAAREQKDSNEEEERPTTSSFRKSARQNGPLQVLHQTTSKQIQNPLGDSQLLQDRSQEMHESQFSQKLANNIKKVGQPPPNYNMSLSVNYFKNLSQSKISSTKIEADNNEEDISVFEDEDDSDSEATSEQGNKLSGYQKIKQLEDTRQQVSSLSNQNLNFSKPTEPSKKYSQPPLQGPAGVVEALKESLLPVPEDSLYLKSGQNRSFTKSLNRSKSQDSIQVNTDELKALAYEQKLSNSSTREPKGFRGLERGQSARGVGGANRYINQPYSTSLRRDIQSANCLQQYKNSDIAVVAENQYQEEAKLKMSIGFNNFVERVAASGEGANSAGAPQEAGTAKEDQQRSSVQPRNNLPRPQSKHIPTGLLKSQPGFSPLVKTTPQKLEGTQQSRPMSTIVNQSRSRLQPSEVDSRGALIRDFNAGAKVPPSSAQFANRKVNSAVGRAPSVPSQMEGGHPISSAMSSGQVSDQSKRKRRKFRPVSSLIAKKANLPSCFFEDPINYQRKSADGHPARSSSAHQMIASREVPEKAIEIFETKAVLLTDEDYQPPRQTQPLNQAELLSQTRRVGSFPRPESSYGKKKDHPLSNHHYQDSQELKTEGTKDQTEAEPAGIVEVLDVQNARMEPSQVFATPKDIAGSRKNPMAKKPPRIQSGQIQKLISRQQYQRPMSSIHPGVNTNLKNIDLFNYQS